MKNKIEDLRNHLFAQLERLGEDEKMKNPLALEREIKRAKSISDISQVLVDAAKVEVDYVKALGNLPAGTLPGSNFIPVEKSKSLGDGKHSS